MSIIDPNNRHYDFCHNRAALPPTIVSIDLVNFQAEINNWLMVFYCEYSFNSLEFVGI